LITRRFSLSSYTGTIKDFFEESIFKEGKRDMKKMIPCRQFILLLVIASIAGCIFDSEKSTATQLEPKEILEPDETHQELVTKIATTFTRKLKDTRKVNGVQLKLYECQSEEIYLDAELSCPVDADEVLVGGGAFIPTRAYFYSYFSSHILTASYPSDDLTRWHVASKYHHYGDEKNNSPYVYAIGMKVDGLSRSQLRSYIQLNKNISGTSRAPQVVATVSGADYMLISGGAKVNWTGYGSLLVNSYPWENSWVAEAKDHIYSSYATIISYAISIKRSIPINGIVRQLSVNHYTSTGQFPFADRHVSTYSDAFSSITLLGKDLLTSVGANSYGWKIGRLLTALYPGTLSGVTATSQALKYVEHGYINTHSLALRVADDRMFLTGYRRIKNMASSSYSEKYIHIENGLSFGTILSGWWSAQWEFERLGNYYRIKNKWKPDHYLHIENGSLECGPILSGWWSAQWDISERLVDGKQVYLIENRWKRGEYLYNHFGTLKVNSKKIIFQEKDAFWVIDKVNSY
jgi:hypothetical protein